MNENHFKYSKRGESKVLGKVLIAWMMWPLLKCLPQGTLLIIT